MRPDEVWRHSVCVSQYHTLYLQPNVQFCSGPGHTTLLVLRGGAHQEDTCNGNANLASPWVVRPYTCSPIAPLPAFSMAVNGQLRNGNVKKDPAPAAGDARPLARKSRTSANVLFAYIGTFFKGRCVRNRSRAPRCTTNLMVQAAALEQPMILSNILLANACVLLINDSASLLQRSSLLKMLCNFAAFCLVTNDNRGDCKNNCPGWHLPPAWSYISTYVC